MIGHDAGELAGLGASGIKVSGDVAPLLKDADGLIEFTIPAASLALAELSAAAGVAHIMGTTGHSAEQEALIAKAACANEDCLVRAAAKVAVPGHEVVTLKSIQPRSVKRGATTTFRLVLGKRLQKLVAASLRKGNCPLAAIRVVAANDGGYRLSASRTVMLAPNARACK